MKETIIQRIDGSVRPTQRASCLSIKLAIAVLTVCLFVSMTACGSTLPSPAQTPPLSSIVLSTMDFNATATSTPVFSMPSITSTVSIPSTSITQSIISETNPPVLYSSVITLKSDKSGGEISKSSFNFDANNVDKPPYKENDIAFGLTISSPGPFLVLGPSFGATGTLLRFGQSSYVVGSEVFNFNDCYSIMKTFGPGGIPIPALGTSYCWLTNQRPNCRVRC